MNWLLDTDVICQPGKRHWRRTRGLVAGAREKPMLYERTVVLAQLAYWVRTKQGRQRLALQAWLRRLVDAMHGRILGFNISVSQVWAEQEHALEKAGTRMPVEDSYIAPTAKRYGFTIATGNEQDFRRPWVKVFNPFTERQKHGIALSAIECSNSTLRSAISLKTRARADH